MKKIIRGGVVAAVAVVATIALAAPAQAYVVQGAHHFGEYEGVTNGAGTITEIDMNVGDTSGQYYHEYDLTFTPGVDGVITFVGVGMQREDNNGESISGGVIDTNARKITFTSSYYTGSAPDGRVWTITEGVLGATSDDGFTDWTGDWNGVHWTGSIKLPTFDPAPKPGNHGEYVSGAAKAGIKGKALAAIAQNGLLIGPYLG